MTTDDDKIQAAIDAAMMAPVPQKQPEAPAKPKVPGFEGGTEEKKDAPAVEEAAPPKTSAEASATKPKAAPPEGLENWSQVDEMLEESLEERRQDEHVKKVLLNMCLCFAALGVIAGAGYWYLSSEKNQASVSGLMDDVKVAVKSDMNVKKVVESYEESLAEIQAHQNTIQEAGAALGGEEVVQTPANGTAGLTGEGSVQQRLSALKKKREEEKEAASF